jgi:hypothetical protein
MDISHETPAQTHKRLLQVIAHADMHIYQQPYLFQEWAPASQSLPASAEALALVRDDEVWSQLAPAEDLTQEVFQVFRFHFPEGWDNSGFVGWLASHLKQTFGTGVFVICGYNSRQGGIFDYWGCPVALAEAILQEIALLIKQGREEALLPHGTEKQTWA